MIENNSSGYNRTKLNSSDRVTALNCEEKALEEGKLFSVREKISIPPQSSFYLFGKTGNLENFVYMALPTISVKGDDINIFAYEGGNFSENGQIAVILQNNNLVLKTISQWLYMKPVSESDIISKGTLFYKDFAPVADSVGGRSGSGENSINERYKFNKDTMYCMEVKNESESTTSTLFFRLKWIETNNYG